MLEQHLEKKKKNGSHFGSPQPGFRLDIPWSLTKNEEREWEIKHMKRHPDFLSNHNERKQFYHVGACNGEFMDLKYLLYAVFLLRLGITIFIRKRNWWDQQGKIEK